MQLSGARVVKRKSNMALVSVSVYCITSKTTLLSISFDDPDTTFRALFRERLKPTIGHECELEKVYVGRDKNASMKQIR